MSESYVVKSYLVQPLREARTPVFAALPLRDLVCECGNSDQDKFLTVTSLGRPVSLIGFVCADCEDRAACSQTI